MTSCFYAGPERPGLIAAAARRGIALTPIPEAADAVGFAAGIACPGAARTIPVLELVSDEAALVAALDAGAADAVALSASDEMLAARLAALARRRAPAVAVGELRIDPIERRATRSGRPVALLPREYALLLHLARNAERCVPRAELREAVWGLDFDPGTNTIEVHVSRLRAKLERGFASPMLLTEKGRGYRLVANAPAVAAGRAGP